VAQGHATGQEGLEVGLFVGAGKLPVRRRFLDGRHTLTGFVGRADKVRLKARAHGVKASGVFGVAFGPMGAFRVLDRSGRPPSSWGGRLAWLGLVVVGLFGVPGCGAKGDPQRKAGTVHGVHGDSIAKAGVVRTPPEPRNPVAPEPESPPGTLLYFEEIAAQVGIDYVTYSATTPEKLFPTANGNGVAFVDYDQDGWLDVYFASAAELRTGKMGPPNGLFRSLQGRRFVRVDHLAKADVVGFTQGLAVGDMDNDGFPDLHLVRYGPDILLRNNGDGTFSDDTAATGLGEPRWGTSAGFLDYDVDGNADLYICHYGKWDLAWHDQHECALGNPPERVYCSPRLLDPEIHALYRNDGQGHFKDVCAELGIDRPDGRGQGVVIIDVNNDSYPDIYVANDLTPNFLFLNNGKGGFEDLTMTSLAAYNAEGREEAGMGTDAGDVNGDGLAELFVTNFYNEHNTIYWNQGGTLFVDMSYQWGTASGSMSAVGWGTCLEDLDGDGDLDIFVTNGHVDDNLERISDRPEPHHQKAGLWENRGGRLWYQLNGVGEYFQKTYAGRGAAFGDFDNDGDVDIVVSYKDQPGSLLRNASRGRFSWIQLRLVGTRSLRDAIGARVEIVAGDLKISRQVRGGRSYASAHDYRLTIGLGPAQRIDELQVVWPGGRVTKLQNVAVNQSLRIAELTGQGDASPQREPSASSP
jgi:hypothetical protein